MKIDDYLIRIDRFENHSYLVKPFYEGYHHHLLPGLYSNQNISLGDRVIPLYRTKNFFIYLAI
jgi:hypothetical protein